MYFSSLESSGADGGSSSRQRRRHRETSHRSQGPVTTIADLNDLLEDALEGVSKNFSSLLLHLSFPYLKSRIYR